MERKPLAPKVIKNQEPSGRSLLKTENSRIYFFECFEDYEKKSL